MKEIKLNSKITAYNAGKEISDSYSAILHKTERSGQEWVLSILDEKGNRTPANWRVSSVIAHSMDSIYIDLGLKWEITGFYNLINEIITKFENEEI